MTKINRKIWKFFKGLRTKNNGNKWKMTLEYQKNAKKLEKNSNMDDTNKASK